MTEESTLIKDMKREFSARELRYLPVLVLSSPTPLSLRKGIHQEQRAHAEFRQIRDADAA